MTNAPSAAGGAQPASGRQSPANVDGERPPRLSVAAATVVAILLLIPLVALALVPSYSGTKPALWGFPFFYWYQLLWVLLTPVLTYSAYLVIKRARGER